jgi:hypothetical protein
MTDSAVLDTVLGLVSLFYALALLCSGLVEMIANWVKKRAKYPLLGIQDLLGNVVAVDMPASGKRRLEEMPATARTLLLNGMVEHRRYDAMLHAPVPEPPGEPATAVPSEAGVGLATEQPLHRDKITLADVMGHPWCSPSARNITGEADPKFLVSAIERLLPDHSRPPHSGIGRTDAGRHRRRRTRTR